MQSALRFTATSLIISCVLTGSLTMASGQDASSAKSDYEANCAACHGRNGKGDGPVGQELRTRPPDLTILARKNDGVFPSQVLYQIIDGRRTIRAHGTYDMPVWGSAFQATGADRNVENRISAIVSYLKSIQIK